MFLPTFFLICFQLCFFWAVILFIPYPVSEWRLWRSIFSFHFYVALTFLCIKRRAGVEPIQNEKTMVWKLVLQTALQLVNDLKAAPGFSESGQDLVCYLQKSLEFSNELVQDTWIIKWVFQFIIAARNINNRKTLNLRHWISHSSFPCLNMLAKRKNVFWWYVVETEIHLFNIFEFNSLT